MGCALNHEKLLFILIGSTLLTPLAYSNEWYAADAKPSLVVRDSPDVSGDKMGNVPYGGKLKIIERVGGSESIGGREGHWVKVEWQNKTGYVFDAFLKALDSEENNSESKSSATNKADDTEWFKSNAEPNLVVRSKPDVTGSKIGNVPYGGKVKLVEVVSKRESINGREGRWVKINWQDTKGYVFDAYLEPAAKLRTGVNSVSSSSSLNREIAMQLGLFNLVAAEEGYAMTHDLKQGELGKEASESHSLKLQKGTAYRILTACDNNCSDLDTSLIDENGNEVDADYKDNDLPVLSITPKWTGTFNLKISMASCKEAPCDYGIAVFGK